MLCIGDIYRYAQIRIDFGTGQRMCTHFQERRKYLVAGLDFPPSR